MQANQASFGPTTASVSTSEVSTETSRAAVQPRTAALRTISIQVTDRISRWPWRTLLLPVSLLWLLSRIVLMLLTPIAVVLGNSAGPASRTPLNHPAYTVSWLILQWRIWDASFYDYIAMRGYDHVAYSAWFPLLPLLEHFLAFGSSHTFYAGFVVANLATLIAAILLGMLARDMGIVPALPVAILLASPFAFFLFTAYTEPIVLCCAAAVLLAVHRRAFGWATLAAAIAVSANPVGMTLLIPLVWELVRSRGIGVLPRLRLSPRTSLLVALLFCPLYAFTGLIAYSVYCWRTWGDPIEFARVESIYHGRVTWWPWQTVGLVWNQLSHEPLLSYLAVRQLLDIVPVVAVLIVSILAARYLPVSFTLYSLGVVLFVLTSPIVNQQVPDALSAACRFMLLAVPVWLVLGKWTRQYQSLQWACIMGGAMLQGILVLFVLNGGWLI